MYLAYSFGKEKRLWNKGKKWVIKEDRIINCCNGYEACMF